MINSIFGRINSDGNIDVLHETGECVTRFDDSITGVYPVGSDITANYEHPNGITLSKEDAVKIGLSIEDAWLLEDGAESQAELTKYTAHSGKLIVVDTAELPEYNYYGSSGYYTCEDNEAVYVMEYNKYLGDNKIRQLPQVTIPSSFRNELERMIKVATAEFEAEYELKMQSLDGVEKFTEPAAFSDDVRNIVKALQSAAQYKDIESAACVMMHFINEFSEKYSSGDFIYKGLV
jgi:hypothetical protein